MVKIGDHVRFVFNGKPRDGVVSGAVNVLKGNWEVDFEDGLIRHESELTVLPRLKIAEFTPPTPIDKYFVANSDEGWSAIFDAINTEKYNVPHTVGNGDNRYSLIDRQSAINNDENSLKAIHDVFIADMLVAYSDLMATVGMTEDMARNIIAKLIERYGDFRSINEQFDMLFVLLNGYMIKSRT